jgi:hypothetical protein
VTSLEVPAYRRVVVATGRADLTDATLLARRIERTGREVSVASEVRGEDLEGVDVLIAFDRRGSGGVLAATAVGCPLLCLTRAVSGTIDVDEVLAARVVHEHPLIEFRLDGRPARSAFAELTVSMDRGERMRADLPGRTSGSVGRIRISNADPLRLLPRAAAVVAAGIVAEWSSGNGPQRTVQLGSGDRIALSSPSGEPLVASVDGRRLSAIAGKVHVAVGHVLRLLEARR